MSDAARRSTVSGHACEVVPDVRSSDAADARDGRDSPPSGTPYLPLRKRRDFARLYRLGRRSQGPGFVVLAAGRKPGPPRVAIVAGRKVGSSVHRNRAKRRLRGAVQRTALREGTDYVIIASPAVLEVPFERLLAGLAEAVAEVADP